jgi:hypothetical protein
MFPTTCRGINLSARLVAPERGRQLFALRAYTVMNPGATMRGAEKVKTVCGAVKTQLSGMKE